MHRSLSVFSLIVAALLVECGCGLFSDSTEEYRLDIRSDETTYVADPATTIRLTITNRSDSQVYLLCDGSPRLEELKGGNVVGSWGASGLSGCEAISWLEKGQIATGEYSFSDGAGLGGVQDAVFDSSVEYVIQFEVFKDNGLRDPIERSATVSNRFTIVRP
jgi:hypothetical protein